MRKNLKTAREEKGLTQQQTADAIDLMKRQYQALEHGTSLGSVRVWIRLKELLSAPSIDHLLEDEEACT